MLVERLMTQPPSALVRKARENAPALFSAASSAARAVREQTSRMTNVSCAGGAWAGRPSRQKIAAALLRRHSYGDSRLEAPRRLAATRGSNGNKRGEHGIVEYRAGSGGEDDVDLAADRDNQAPRPPRSASTSPRARRATTSPPWSRRSGCLSRAPRPSTRTASSSRPSG